MDHSLKRQRYAPPGKPSPKPKEGIMESEIVEMVKEIAFGVKVLIAVTAFIAGIMINPWKRG